MNSEGNEKRGFDIGFRCGELAGRNGLTVAETEESWGTSFGVHREGKPVRAGMDWDELLSFLEGFEAGKA